MTGSTQPQSCCKSIFKNGEETTTKGQFTRKWVELIHQMESDPNTCAPQR